MSRPVRHALFLWAIGGTHFLSVGFSQEPRRDVAPPEIRQEGVAADVAFPGMIVDPVAKGPPAPRPFLFDELQKLLRITEEPAPLLGSPADAVAAARAMDIAKFQPQQTLTPIMRAELHRLNAVYELTPEQKRDARRAAERALDRTVAELAKALRGWNGWLPPGCKTLDPRVLYRQQLEQSIQEILPSVSLDRYREEMQSRTAAHREAAVRNLMVILEERLVLSVKQREQIGAALLADWHDVWCPTSESIPFLENPFPALPEEYVVPYLNESQITLWRMIPMLGYGRAGLNLEVLNTFSDNAFDGESDEADAVGRSESSGSGGIP